MASRNRHNLSAQYLKSFSTDARKVVKRAMGLGWTGYVSANGHAIMLAPDGETTISISSGKSDSYSVKNAHGDLNRWLRSIE